MDDVRVATFVMRNGERYCLLVRPSVGLPLYYPNLYITSQVRNRGDSFAAAESAAGSLVVLEKFLSRRGIDLDGRIARARLLLPHELDSLSDFCQLRFRKKNQRPALHPMFTEAELQEGDGFVAAGTHYVRLTHIAKYLSWYARHLLPPGDQRSSLWIDQVSEQLKARRPRLTSKGAHRIDRSLNDLQVKALFEVIRPESELNPFNKEVRGRNRLMILLLFFLGIRCGELLNIRLRDFDAHAHRLKITRRADAPDDPRKRQPLVKTEPRTLPLSPSLVRELYGYIQKDRRCYRAARSHDYLFVTHKPGPTQGAPLSIAAYQKVIRVVREVAPQLYSLTGHMLRHDWNFRFSQLLDFDKQLSPEEQEMVRSELMGWKPGSGTATHYNKRFIREKAWTASLQLQEASGTRLPGKLRE